ncbi:MAG: hypothetical protein M1129_03980 [Candidatus Thermoplasmatota archaeon]|nr:hypothetical protein [Candidatus Thermoplasmatota archaeon]MCL5955258.1 hypothetical protein [Candidatus Thermoplasmatota archaeon]
MGRILCPYHVGLAIPGGNGRESSDRTYSAGELNSGSEAQIAADVVDGCRVAFVIYGDLIRSGKC